MVSPETSLGTRVLVHLFDNKRLTIRPSGQVRPRTVE